MQSFLAQPYVDGDQPPASELTESVSAVVGSMQFDERQRQAFTGVTADQAQTTEAIARFVCGALVADWACYHAAEDRADYQRLHNVITAFPRGFRLWSLPGNDGHPIPVAYTGWYPVSTEAFSKAHDMPAALTHRRELWPLSALPNDGAFIWLFNYCIVESLRRSTESRRMLRAYADDLAAIEVSGMAAAVLSEESKRVVAKFGMTYRGDMTHDGVAENVFATRRPILPPK